MTETFLDKIKNRMEETKEEFQLTERLPVEGQVVKLSPNDIGNWEYRDRQSFELGDINELANSINTKGQAQPIVVVESSEEFVAKDNAQVKYVVIAGYRRWLACKMLNLLIDAVIKKFTFEQAIACVLAENEKETVSDYSKGMFFYNLLQKEKVTKSTLYNRFGMKRSQFNNYLAFSEVPKDFWDAIGDLSKVSARTASTIKLLMQKSEEHKRALFLIVEKIRDGIGERTIQLLVEKEVSKKEQTNVVQYNVIRKTFPKGVVLATDSKGFRLECKKLDSNEKEKLQNYLEDLLNDFTKGQ